MAEIIVTSTADSGAGSLRQAIARAQDGDVILFDSDVFPAGQTTSILLSSYLTINKSVSIYGGFSDGAGGYTSGATITRYVIREVEGVETEVVVDDEHPALENEVVLMHVTTRVALDGQTTQDPNAADEWSGWTGSRVFYSVSSSSASDVVKTTVSGLTFQNGLCTASEYSAVWCMSVAAMGLRTRFEDCKIANCINSSGIAGAITLRSLSESNYTFTRCEFRDCKAKSSAGGIYTRDNSSSSFNSCVITNCKAVTSGGGFYSHSSSQNILNDCTFSKCNAGTFGGAVVSYSTSQNTFNSCVVNDCSADSNGGGVYSASSSKNTLNNCLITNCIATTTGGGLYANNSSQNILNASIISDCSASSGGGANLAGATQSAFTDCVITNCNVATNGGGVYIATPEQNTFSNCSFSQCSAGVSGGGILCAAGTNTLNNCTFADCASPAGGGVRFQGGSINTLSGCTINGCKSSASGGAIYSNNSESNTINNCTITGCTASNSGAGIYASGASQNIITDCTIEDCNVEGTLTSKTGGGLHATSTCHNVLTGCRIARCSAYNGGGAWLDSTSTSDFVNCVFDSNTALNNGAGVYAYAQSVSSFANCIFNNNAFHSYSAPHISIAATKFERLHLASDAVVTVMGGISTATEFVTDATAITIADGAALTITTSATIGAATFTSAGRGYLAVGAGIDTSSATLTNVVLCAYGADVSSFAEVDGVLEWEAANPTTTVLIERADGDSWTTVTQTAGESLTLYLPPSDTVRLFDGVQFFVVQAPAQRTYYYIGGAEGSFTSAADWSLRRGGVAITEPPVVAGQKFIVGDISSGE